MRSNVTGTPGTRPSAQTLIASVCFLVMLLPVILTYDVAYAEGDSVLERLSFISDAHTTRVDVLLRLGIPYGRFEDDRILTYMFNGAGTRRDGGPCYSLVLVFDEKGVLKRHSIVRMAKERFRW